MGIRIEDSTATIHSVVDLSTEQAVELRKNNITKIQIIATAYSTNIDTGIEIEDLIDELAELCYAGYHQKEPYDIDTYIAVRTKLDELVEDIDMSSNDEEKFAIIYSRICKNITYDYPAAYPIGPTEEQYAQDNNFKSRNLINGLLQGKCVCAGYADILRSALELAGIEACYVEGPIAKKKELQTIKRITKKSYFLKGKSIIRKEKLNRRLDIIGNSISFHAWVKVKINGIWYNCDPTWDADNIRNGLEPSHALLSDKQCKKHNKLIKPIGPDCITDFPKQKINQLFRHDNLISAEHSNLGNTILKSINRIRENIMIFLKRRPEALPKGEKTDISEKVGNKTEQSPLSEQQPLKRWDLRNWKINKKQFGHHLPKNNNKLSQNTLNRNSNER